MTKPTKKKPMRRTEVFNIESRPEGLGRGFWKPIKFNNLKQGHIFRCFDTMDNGVEKPDQVDKKGNHMVHVALEDAKEKPMPELGVVKCLPVRGFTKER